MFWVLSFDLLQCPGTTIIRQCNKRAPTINGKRHTNNTIKFRILCWYDQRIWMQLLFSSTCWISTDNWKVKLPFGNHVTFCSVVFHDENITQLLEWSIRKCVVCQRLFNLLFPSIAMECSDQCWQNRCDKCEVKSWAKNKNALTTHTHTTMLPPSLSSLLSFSTLSSGGGNREPRSRFIHMLFLAHVKDNLLVFNQIFTNDV